ncbi:MAG: DMT family transporter [Pseudomonadota bacterium]
MSSNYDLITTLRDSISRQAAALPNPTKGMLWMLAGGVCMTVVISLIRMVSEDIHALQVAFFRNVFSLLFMVPWMLSLPRENLRTKRPVMHALRSIFGLTAMCTWFYSVTIMPLAEAVTLSFTTPLFATVLAAFVLREVVRARRWTATIIGFVGVLIVLRPGVEVMQPSAFIVLASAVFLAITMMFVRSLAKTEATSTMLFYTMFWMMPLSLIPALFVWQTPSVENLLWLAAIGLVATGVQGCLAQAFHYGEASFLAPFEYAKLPLTALVGWVAFGETTDVWTWVGAGVIAGATIYIARREGQLAKQSPPIAAPSVPEAAPEAPVDLADQDSQQR